VVCTSIPSILRRCGGLTNFTKKKRHGSSRRKNLNFAEKLGVCFCRVFWCKNSTLRLAHNMYHKGTYLYLKQTAIPHLCPAGNTTAPVWVPPGRAPGGNTRHSGVHCVSSCFLSLCSRILSHHHFFSAKLKIFAKRPISEKKGHAGL
jgi:hypothetical protein